VRKPRCFSPGIEPPAAVVAAAGISPVNSIKSNDCLRKRALVASYQAWQGLAWCGLLRARTEHWQSPLYGLQFSTEDTMLSKSESALRTRAEREGYSVRKSRRAVDGLENRGEYMLVDSRTGFPVLGFKFDAELEDISQFLSE
jgi:hypothetical protein